jgi:aryl-alcohol dehydrogenase-like predicted oxidoreductase
VSNFSEDQLREAERVIPVVAWLLARSPQILPIPGSGSPEHVEQNVAAATIDLDPAEIRAITRAATTT